MPTPVLFTVFSFLLRVVDGTGTAMFMTVSYTLLTQSYPEKRGTIVVSDITVEPTIAGHHRELTFCLLKLLSTINVAMFSERSLLYTMSNMQFIKSCIFYYKSHENTTSHVRICIRYCKSRMLHLNVQ